MAGSYYEGLRMTDRGSDLRVTCCFETESEQDFTEYTRPYIYLYVWGLSRPAPTALRNLRKIYIVWDYALTKGRFGRKI